MLLKVVAAVLLLGIASAASAAEAVEPAGPSAQGELAELSLEELGEVLVRSVSLRDEPIDTLAAAVYILSGQDIRRAGATSLPEALRLVPTLDVARADANQYAVSARGFNNVLANKLLVVIDGRPVYSPLFSGVFWEAQAVPMDDIDRIEVVTGPSTALWGTNAVNGLIHVITRRASATTGTAATGYVGDQDRGASLRHGWRVGDVGWIRAYAATLARGDTERADGSSVSDAARGWQAGFRGDLNDRGLDLTLQGDHYAGRSDQPATPPRSYDASHLLARAAGRTATGREWTVQGYVDRNLREHPGSFREELLTVDLVGQWGGTSGRHRWLLGAGYRWSHDEVSTGPAFTFKPEDRRLQWARAFAHDELAWGSDLKLSGSLSLEHNPYTGVEALPSLRAAWTPAAHLTLWGSLSRAMRAPSRVDREFFQPAEPPHLLDGGPGFDSERSTVLELGLRGTAGPALAFGATAFRHEHRGLRSVAATPSGLQFRNDIEGHTQGVQAWWRWHPHRSWRLDGGLVVLDQERRVRQGGQDFGGMAALGNDPDHWLQLRSSVDLSPHWTWDSQLRHVGRRPAPDVPAYTALDMRVAWRLRPSAELALAARNLTDERHAEWGVPANRVELRRSAWLQLRWTWP